MNREEVLGFMKRERLGVLATIGSDGQPEAALMGFAVTPALEMIFDTVKTSRKYPNLKENPRVALVIGCSSEITVQYEGWAEELGGESVTKYLPVYFEAFPDGLTRREWPGIVYFVVRPTWIRYCDYHPDRRRVEEQTF